jgi:hypothetical protein
VASSSIPAARAPSTGPEISGVAPAKPGLDATVSAVRPALAPATALLASMSAAIAPEQDPILCGHCGRSASNGISCIGMCVADSGY